MKKLASASGIVIYEEGQKLYICKTSAAWTSTFLFVNGLLLLVFLANGVLQLSMANVGKGSTKIGIILLVIGVLLFFLFFSIWNLRKRKAAVPFSELQTIAIFDFENNNLLESQQQILAPLQQVWLKRKMQLSSSSPELRVQWNAGSISLGNGNPFSGGVGKIEKVLLAKGIRRR